MMFALVSYWMIGLQSDHAKFLNFVITTVLINFVAASLCMAMSSLAGSYGQASLFSVLIMIFSMMFGGLFLNNNTQTLSKILNRLSFIHYGYEVCSCLRLLFSLMYLLAFASRDHYSFLIRRMHDVLVGVSRHYS